MCDGQVSDSLVGNAIDVHAQGVRRHTSRVYRVSLARRDDVNKAYRKLAVLLHPDKSVAPGSEDAFKILVATRTALLKNAR